MNRTRRDSDCVTVSFAQIGFWNVDEPTGLAILVTLDYIREETRSFGADLRNSLK